MCCTWLNVWNSSASWSGVIPIPLSRMLKSSTYCGGGRVELLRARAGGLDALTRTLDAADSRTALSLTVSDEWLPADSSTSRRPLTCNSILPT